MESNEVKVLQSWEEADSAASKYVKFAEGKEKKIVIKDWQLELKLDSMSTPPEKKVFFCAKVLKEDGQDCNKLLERCSNRLRAALRTVLENRNPSEPILIGVTKIGNSYSTDYKVICYDSSLRKGKD